MVAALSDLPHQKRNSHCGSKVPHSVGVCSKVPCSVGVCPKVPRLVGDCSCEVLFVFCLKNILSAR